MLKKLAANSDNFFRIWMIYWNLPVDLEKYKQQQPLPEYNGNF
jgi:hypothetical protein